MKVLCSFLTYSSQTVLSGNIHLGCSRKNHVLRYKLTILASKGLTMIPVFLFGAALGQNFWAGFRFVIRIQNTPSGAAILLLLL